MAATNGIRLHLIGGFAVEVDGERPRLPDNAKRLVAVTALAAPAPVRRAYLADLLWADLDDAHAAGSLRSALWRLHRTCPGLLLVDDGELRIGEHVWVDMHAFTGAAGPVDADDWPVGELLPGWNDEWLLVERERIRLALLHALEAAARRALAAGDPALAVRLGLRAVATEPLRESATRVVIDAHLAEGNVADAIYRYRQFADGLRTELGIAPTAALTELIESAVVDLTDIERPL